MLGFLPEHIRALIFVMFALALCWLLLRLCRYQRENSDRLLAAWTIITIAAFVAPDFIVFAVVVFGVARWIAPRTAIDRVVLYVALLPVIAKINYAIPGVFGINYLFNLNYVRLLTIILLLPIFMVRRSAMSDRAQSDRARHLILDTFVLLFLIWTWLAQARQTSITDGLRALFEIAVFTALPYFAIRRSIRNTDDMRRVFEALALSAFVVACIVALEQRTDWWFYRYLPSRLGRSADAFWVAQEFRGGFIRVKGPIDGGLAYLMILGIASLWVLRRVMPSRRLLVLGIPAMLLAIWFTGARGPLLAIAMFLAVLIAFRFFASPVRFFLWVGGGLLLFPWLERMIASAEDQYGTFSYRQALLESSIPLIRERFIFGYGSLQAIEGTGRLEHLRQGEGIIDIVNHYLFIGLISGGIAMLLFIGILVLSIASVLRTSRISHKGGDPFFSDVRRVIVALLISTAVLIGTTSVIGHFTEYLWLLLALTAAYIRAGITSPGAETGLQRASSGISNSLQTPHTRALGTWRRR